MSLRRAEAMRIEILGLAEAASRLFLARRRKAMLGMKVRCVSSRLLLLLLLVLVLVLGGVSLRRAYLAGAPACVSRRSLVEC